METNWQNRTISLYGDEAVKKVGQKKVAILGIGGVGCAVSESLCRFGINNFTLLDHDKYKSSNLNRQLFATSKNLNEYKAEIAKKRLKEINCDVNVKTLNINYNEENKDIIFEDNPDIVVDCIDNLTSKLILAEETKSRNIKLISCMGTGNRIDPSKFKIGKMEDTKGCGCPLATRYRKELKKRGIYEIPVLYSTEIPKKISIKSENGRHIPASSPFCPPTAGFIIGSYVIKMLS